MLFPLLTYHANANNLTRIEGWVTDELTNQPIENAIIQIWDTTPASSSIWTLVEQVKTDTNGYYSINLGKEFQCRVYAYYNDSNTPGFDYVPSFQDFFVSGEKQLEHDLKPGGLIIFEGILRVVESIRPADVYSFIVLDPDTGTRPVNEGEVYDYGTEPQHHNFLDLEPKYIIIPANTPIDILVNMTISVDGDRMERTFLASHIKPFILDKGEKKQVEIDDSLLLVNANLVENKVLLLDETLVKVEKKEFYTTLNNKILQK